MCGHHGCVKTFCRKTTMVKHQRRSHQPGALVDDATSESGGDDSPSTPRAHHANIWGQQPHGQMMIHNGMGMQRPMPGQYMQPPYEHRHSLSSNGPEYPNNMHSEHAMMRRMSNAPMPQQYFVEAHNPAVATMNASQFQSVPRQHNNPYTEPGLTASLNSSPSTFSSASVRSPVGDSGFNNYALHSTQAATHALQGAEHQHAAMGQFQHPATTQAMMPNQPMMTIPMHNQHSQQQHPQSPGAQGVYHQQLAASAPDNSQAMYAAGLPAYQDPVSAGHVPASYGWGISDVKFEDPSGLGMGMPSDRIAQMG
ncbi:hypothetical protein FJTKL_05118 [Diaporthe vaccinii]